METQNLTQLKEEINRLNGIINALLFQNNALQTENAGLKKIHIVPIIGTRHGDNSVSFQTPRADRNIQLPGSNQPEMIGMNEKSGSNHLRMVGMDEKHHSNHPVMAGTKENTSPIIQKQIGTRDLTEHIRQDMIGTNVALPAFIETGGWSFGTTLPRFLQNNAGMLKSKHSGLRNVARVLIHLHNNKSGGRAELRELTKLSKGGLAKLMMAMVRRGWITRVRYRRVELAPGGTQLLQRWYQPHAKAVREWQLLNTGNSQQGEESGMTAA